MSAAATAATAAGYLYASGILDWRRQQKALTEQSIGDVLQEVQRISIQPTYATPLARVVKVTYRKRRIPGPL